MHEPPPLKLRSRAPVKADCGPSGSLVFDILSSPTKLKTRRFKIELATDDEIRNAAPGLTLLVDTFDYVNEGKNDLLSRLER